MTNGLYMKLIPGLALVAFLTTSCVVTQECSTYDGSKGHVFSTAGMRKAKPPRDRTPFYKVQKTAEKD